MRFRAAVVMGFAALAGCGERGPPVAALPIEHGDARIEWRGLSACADCDRIETVLVLERAGDARRYDLSETFVAAGDGARFGEVGDWRMHDATIDLAGDDGARRRYRVLPQGALRPHDAPATGDVGLLLPYQASTR